MADTNTILTTTASVVTAGVLATGAIMYATGSNEQQVPVVDNITGIDVEIPNINTPTIQTISVSIPKIEYYKKTDFIENIQKIIGVEA